MILVQARPLNRLFLKFITSFGKKIRVTRFTPGNSTLPFFCAIGNNLGRSLQVPI